MTRAFLPSREPFGEMMAFASLQHVELVMKVRTLVKCRTWEATFIDLHAGYFEPLADHCVRFTYTNRQWLHLCEKLRRFDPDAARCLAGAVGK